MRNALRKCKSLLKDAEKMGKKFLIIDSQKYKTAEKNLEV